MTHIVTMEEYSADNWIIQRRTLLQFARRCGGLRISRELLRPLATLSTEQLEQEGASLLYAYVRTEQGPQIAGFCLAVGFGHELCMVVIRPLYRGRGLGTRLLQEQLSRLEYLVCTVDHDHTAAKKMCYHAGLTATGITSRPGGKTVIVYEGKLHQAERPPFKEGALSWLKLS